MVLSLFFEQMHACSSILLPASSVYDKTIVLIYVYKIKLQK